MKRILSLALVLVMALGMVTTSYAAAPKIDGMVHGLAMGYSSDSSYIDLGDVHPGDETVLHIDLPETMFSWTDGYEPASPTQLLSSTQIRNGKLTVRANNTRVLDSVTINNSRGRIEVAFRKELVATNEQDFEFTITLSVNGRRQTDHELTFSGTFTNYTMEIDTAYDDVDISDGTVLEADGNIGAITLNTGHDVYVVARLFSGSKVYAVSDRTPTSADESVMAQYRIVEGVIQLKTAGIRGNSNMVKLGREYDEYQILDADLNYLGTNKDLLPLKEKYYLAAKTAELPKPEPVEEPKEESEPSSENAKPSESTGTINENPNMGGDDEAPRNANDNPGTGR